MALLGMLICPTSVRMRMTRAVISVTFPGMLLTMMSSPTLSWCVAKINAPESMPPTNVDMIKPAVTEIMPALVRSDWAEKSSVFRMPKVIINAAIASITYWRIVAACVPICGVKSGFSRRKNNIAVSQNAKIMIISTACGTNIGKFIGTTMAKSKM